MSSFSSRPIPQEAQQLSSLNVQDNATAKETTKHSLDKHRCFIA
jgi:hypothetical protein